MSRIVIAHPILHQPSFADFGEHPRLLQALLANGLVEPLMLDPTAQVEAARIGQAALNDLESVHGVASVVRFVEQASICDQATRGRQVALATRLRDWTVFQERQVRSMTGHHDQRVPTPDGVEADAFGDWARAAAVILSSSLEEVASPGQGLYLMATLARSLKCQARADAAQVTYQSHPLRRDFSLTFDLTRGGAGNMLVLDVIKAVRGIHESLSEAAGASETHRLQLLQLELPLLGGRLWSPQDAERLKGRAWIEFVVDRIGDYRERAADLRQIVAHCVSEEDYLRLARDIDGVKRQLLERLGLHRVELSSMERELVSSVASVAQITPGVPSVSGLWFGARAIGKKAVFSGSQPFQRFLYREFIDAWKRAGR